jgi:hypothetical protein
MRLIPKFSGHACLEPSLAKSRDVCIPRIQSEYTSYLVFSGIAARYLHLGDSYSISTSWYYTSWLLNTRLPGWDFPKSFAVSPFQVGIDPKAHTSNNGLI